MGFGTVGRWLARVLAERYADRFQIVGLANRRDGFFYREDGIDLGAALAIAAEDRSLDALPDVARWSTAIEGMRASDADVLVEVTQSPPPEGEPGRSHLAEALERGIPAVTSNKWPIAIHGVALAELARRQSAFLRAESCVMSGTPVLSTLSEGLAGATPLAIRGVLNATANYILSDMARGQSYADALAAAQNEGLAERDASADVDGHDAVAKAMVLSAGGARSRRSARPDRGNRQCSPLPRRAARSGDGRGSRGGRRAGRPGSPERPPPDGRPSILLNSGRDRPRTLGPVRCRP